MLRLGALMEVALPPELREVAAEEETASSSMGAAAASSSSSGGGFAAGSSRGVWWVGFRQCNPCMHARCRLL